MTQPTQTISPLRQRMIDDMTQRRLNPKTQEAYIRSVVRLTRFLGRSPDTASADELRQFQLHLAQNGVSNKTINATITGLRFFFETTLDDHQALRKMSTVRDPRKLPVILSPDEVKRLLEATTNLKYKSALATAYGAGLRASEVTHLKVTDIDSQRMMIRVEHCVSSMDAAENHSACNRGMLCLLHAWIGIVTSPTRARFQYDMKAFRGIPEPTDHGKGGSLLATTSLIFLIYLAALKNVLINPIFLGLH